MPHCSRIAIAAVPCARCPFRKDVPVYLRADRREEIADSLYAGQDFPCHATVTYKDGQGESTADTSRSVTCAGAAKALMLTGGTTQLMRIAERLGAADLDATAERGAEVWSLDEWRRLAMGSTGDDPTWEIPENVETCNTVDDRCLAPAGFLTGSGGVVRGTVAADMECSECSEAVCSNCADDEGRCGTCRGWDFEDEDEEARVESQRAQRRQAHNGSVLPLEQAVLISAMTADQEWRRGRSSSVWRTRACSAHSGAGWRRAATAGLVQFWRDTTWPPHSRRCSLGLRRLAVPPGGAPHPPRVGRPPTTSLRSVLRHRLGLRQSWAPFHGVGDPAVVGLARVRPEGGLRLRAISNCWRVLEHTSLPVRFPAWFSAVVMTPAGGMSP